MSLPILPNPSNFLGVALVITRTHEGPRLVFHYPPNVLPVQGSSVKDAADDDPDDDDVYVDRDAEPSAFGNAWSSPASAPELAKWNHDDHIFTETGTQIVPWEHVAGFPTKDLEAILTPARAYHKKLFQVSLDPIYCVSYPIYAGPGGKWQKKKKKKQQKPKKDLDDTLEVGPLDPVQPAAGDASLAADAEQVEATDMATSSREKPLEDGEEKGEGKSEDKASSMAMFNLVFILNPKRHEVKELVDTMYSHIIKKVNKVYKYAQQRSDFVWKESKRILALKDKAREDRRKMSSLWNEILSASSLAASMQDVYDAISQNKIAALQLDTPEGTVTHSVQIPMPFHVSDLPPEDDIAARGMWLTTANSFVHDGDVVDGPGYLDKNFALLLTDDDKKIVAELQADPDETTMAMIEFVKHSKPTLSFHQVAQQPNNILTLGQVRKYAQHFIFWRRAIAIPPLHARDTYILSPNCDLARLPRATAEWSRAFPLAPPLPDFLAVLSTAPRPYKIICPSKSFRPDYLRMLAWLMRGGWVTQLCTFAYVVVWPEILYEVEYNLEAEELARAKKTQQAAAEEHAAAAESRGTQEGKDESLPQSASTDKGDQHHRTSDASDAADILPFSPNLSHTVSSLSSTSKDLSLSTATLATNPASTVPGRKPTPTPAEQAAQRARLERLAEKTARELAEKATAHARRVPPSPTPRPSANRARHLAHLSPHLIPDARKPTGRESLYLAAIGKRLRARGSADAPAGSVVTGTSAAGGGRRGGSTKDGSAGKKPDGGPAGRMAAAGAKSWDDRVADSWPLFWRYFDGRSALERIALHEEMKRKDVWNLLTAMSEYLLCVRHW